MIDKLSAKISDIKSISEKSLKPRFVLNTVKHDKPITPQFILDGVKRRKEFYKNFCRVNGIKLNDKIS
tara:strand:+ start:376 stop:579 length:204 start_codon:yes stop_codon:yes gene_type:complete